MKLKVRKKSGVSLIIAIIFVSVLMLVTAGLAEVNLAAIKNRANKTWSDRAKDLANSALELAYYFADGKVGANATIEANGDSTWKEYITFLQEGVGFDCADCTAGFRVIGRSETKNSEGLLKIGDSGSSPYFSVPASYLDDDGTTVRSTGSAAEKCEKSTDADDPCHWNRIYVNDIVEIPLYYDGNEAEKMTQFKLRVRAPCENYKDNCAKNERIELYPKAVGKGEYATTGEPFGDPKKDKVLIQWLISDLNNSGETLFARDVLKNNKRPLPDNTNSNNLVGNNTEISGGRINDANEAFSPVSLPLNNFIVVEYSHNGMNLKKDPVLISKFLSNPSTKPTLRLNLIGQPRKLSGEPIPYLEYQILTDEPIADNKVTLFGWAEIADFYKEFKAEKYLPIMEGGLVLGNL